MICVQTSLEILFVVYNADVGLLVKVRLVCKIVQCFVPLYVHDTHCEQCFTFYPGGDIDHDLLVDSILEPLQWGGR